MRLRQAYANTLRLIRARKGLTQSNLAGAMDASHVSRLENADRGVTLESSEALAEALQMHPLSLLVMAYAIKHRITPREALQVVTDDLARLSYLDVDLVEQVRSPIHPNVVKGAETRKAVQELKAQGLNQVETARKLGISTSAVNRHWDSSHT